MEGEGQKVHGTRERDSCPLFRSLEGRRVEQEPKSEGRKYYQSGSIAHGNGGGSGAASEDNSTRGSTKNNNNGEKVKIRFLFTKPREKREMVKRVQVLFTAVIPLPWAANAP